VGARANYEDASVFGNGLGVDIDVDHAPTRKLPRRRFNNFLLRSIELATCAVRVESFTYISTRTCTDVKSPASPKASGAHR
jgi:hypothetical protein